jgi:hypothetical protein
VRRNGIGTGRTPKTAPERDKRETKRHPIALKRVLRHALNIGMVSVEELEE